MNPTLSVTLLWLAFGGSHIALSSLSLRPKLVAKLGEMGFMGVYSLVALATFAPMVSIYFGNKHTGPMLWSVSMTPPLVMFVAIVMGIAFILLVAGMVTPSPTSFKPPGQEPKEGDNEPKGVHFITRHAVFMAVGLFGAVHLIPNGSATDVAFFAGFPIFAVLGSIHQDQRKLVTDADHYPAFHSVTALIPFTGKQTLRGIKELAPAAWVGGIVVAYVIRYFHQTFFG